MGAQPHCRDGIRSSREQEHEGEGDAEPLNRETRTVQDLNGGKYVNPSNYGVMTLGLSEGDEVVVETHPDRIVIRTEAED